MHHTSFRTNLQAWYLAAAVEYSISIGYAGGAYIYARMAARYAEDCIAAGLVE